MRILLRFLVLVVGAGLCLGCASVKAIKEPTVRVYDKTLVLLHIKKAPEPNVETQPQVCLLDPTTMIPLHSAPPPSASKESPSAEVPEMVHDFGKLNQDGEYVHQFKVKNVGNAVLDIKKVVPGWGLSIAQYDRAIPPGKEGKITVKLNPKTCSGDTQKSTVVTVNDPNNPYLILVLQGNAQL